MAMMDCPECKGSISDQAASCPHCGLPLHPIDKDKVETYDGNWVMMSDPKHLSAKAQKKLLQQANLGDGESILALCAIDRFVSRGELFVIVTNERLLIKTNKVQSFDLAEIVDIQTMSKNIHVATNQGKIALFALGVRPEKALIDRMSQKLTQAWGAARRKAGHADHSLKPAPQGLIAQGLHHLAKRGILTTTVMVWLALYFVVWMSLTALMITKTTRYLVGLPLAVLGIAASLGYLFSPKVRARLGHAPDTTPPGARRKAVGWLLCCLFAMIGLGPAPDPQPEHTWANQRKAPKRGVTPALRLPTSRTPMPHTPIRQIKLIPFQLSSNNDFANPMVTKVIRTLLVAPGHKPQKVRTLLRHYYHAIWQQHRGTTKQTLVYVYIYDSKRYIERGLGEWIAMLNESGSPPPPWPRNTTIRVPDYTNAPSARKQRIYDALQDALHAKRNQGTKESIVNRRVARRLRISKKKLDKVWMEVWLWRNNKESEAQKAARRKRKKVRKRKR